MTPTWVSPCGRATLFLGDCRKALAAWPSGIVQTCVTSPPYYGLRDYGTAQWDGGDDKCNHLKGPLASVKSTMKGYTGKHVKLAVGGMPFRDTCGKCCARRIDQQIGLEPSPDDYVAEMVKVFREVRRVLRDDGTVWLNLGDSYAGNGCGEQGKTGQRANRRFTASNLPSKVCGGYKPKDLMGIPWRVAFALQADGWYLRQDIIWSKPNPMPESVTDRCTKAHEYIFLLAKSERYYFDADAIAEPAAYAGQQRGGSTNRYEQNNFGGDNAVYDTRNKRSVWHVKPQPFKGAHFATYPPELIRPCILAGAPRDGVVLDPFTGSGTTAEVAIKTGRRFMGCELSPDYLELAKKRIADASEQYDGPLFEAAKQPDATLFAKEE